MSADKKTTRVKVISLGDTQTGKTCLIKRYCEKRFVSKYLPTIGVDFGVTKVHVDNHILKVNLFDLSGDDAFAEVRNEFYKDAQAVLLVYDVTIKSSFKNLDCWMKELKCYITDPADVNRLILILVGNKCDKSNRVIEFDQGQLWARENGFYFFEASAQTDDGVTKLFELMFKSLVELLETGARPKSTGKTLGYTKEQVDAIHRLKNGKDHYSKLGLTRLATRDDVNKCYRKLAKILHPDKCLAAESEEAFKLLGISRDILLKEVKS